MDAPKRAMLVANEHAREAITPEVALRFVEDACQGTRASVLPAPLRAWGRKQNEASKTQKRKPAKKEQKQQHIDQDKQNMAQNNRRSGNNY